MKLYLVTDEKLLESKDMYHIIEEAVKGGVTMVQLREKQTSTREYIEHAVKLKQILAPYKVPLIINDRIDVALASDADGVHIGQNDMPYEAARKLIPENKILGLSVESRLQVLEANSFNVTYIAASPVFSTATKSNTVTEWGLDGLKWMRSVSRHPIVAIGGINLSNITDIYKSGADSAAVISAIINAESPQKAARELLNINI